MSRPKKARAGIQRRRQREARRKSILFIGAGLAGLAVILASGWYLRGSRQTAQAAFDYRPEDVVYDRPLHAVHEMEAGPSIPFLPSDGPQPRIAVNESFFNFGSVGPTDVVTRDFVIANLGPAPLMISRAYTTCGCTTADLTSSYIPPGKVAVMTLRFDAGFHDTRGQTVQRGVILENNDPDRSEVEIWVQASVRSSP